MWCIIASCVPVATTATTSTYILPFSDSEAYILTRRFNTRPTHVGKDTYALDFTQVGCNAINKPVLATASGVVYTTVAEDQHETLANYGNQVVIKHAHGIYSRYAHLLQVFVTSTDQVEQGDVIGTIGNTGNVIGTACKHWPGVHLHFAMYQEDMHKQIVAYQPDELSGYDAFIFGRWYIAKKYSVDSKK